MSDMPETEKKMLPESEIRALAREIAGRESKTERINICKKTEANAKAERRLLRVMLSLLWEIGQEQTKESALRLVCSNSEEFIALPKEKQYAEAGEMLLHLRTHITKAGTPQTVEVLSRFNEFPERLRQKAMIMAIYDLSDN